MKRCWISIKDNREFRRLYSRGKSATSATLVCYTRPNRLGVRRLGITASTKLGHAVVRNRVRRRIREIYRLHQEDLRDGADLVVVARGLATQVSYQRLDRDFCRLAKKLGLWRTQEGEER